MSKEQLLIDYQRKIIKALSHLEYSYSKISSLEITATDEESLETWESFVSRFARVVDLFVTKFLKIKVLMDDPAFDGSLRDFCHRAEKMGLLENTERWISLRELRNVAAHDYEENDLSSFFNKVKTETPFVLKIKTLLSP